MPFLLLVIRCRPADFAAMRQEFGYDGRRFKQGAQDANQRQNPAGTTHHPHRRKSNPVPA
ncbi:MAG: hypothetical protein ACOYMW_08220 [Candidatus Competibacteraceae bacterium]